MLHRVFSLFDNKAEAYMTPFFTMNQGLALRSVRDLVMDKNTVVGKHPEDFTLFELGHYSDESGMFETHSPKPVCNCIELAGSGQEKETK